MAGGLSKELATLRSLIRLALPLTLVFSFGPTNVAVGAQLKSGVWDLQCSQPPGSSREHCVLSQAITAEGKPYVGVGIIILKRNDARLGIMQVIAPLSVLLPNGVDLEIDQVEKRHLPFYRCFEAGCRAEIIIDENLFERLNRGKIATIVIHLEPNEGVRHLVPLRGFKEAYEKLK